MTNRLTIHWPQSIDALSARTRRWAIGVAAVPLLFGVLGGTRAAPSPDSGLAGCSALAGAHRDAASDYEAIGAQFADSRWPDLRFSGRAYIQTAAMLSSHHAYGGEIVWFYERLADTCAQHGHALPVWPG